MLRLRVANGLPHRGELAPDADGFRALLKSGEPALLGTFHVGHSDLTGFLLGGQEHRKVYMVRQRVGNSHDTEVLGTRFASWVKFIWVNETENLLFALKDAVAAGGSVALKCDRLEFSAKTEAFQFLGAQRLFPFTIYHLALIFDRPVVLCVGLPAGPGRSLVHSSPLFVRDAAGKAENLARARVHFQEFLTRLEGFLREQPELWFNFLPLNPVAS
jgi:predicted LPLAT superfamily acyltransferase